MNLSDNVEPLFTAGRLRGVSCRLTCLIVRKGPCDAAINPSESAEGDLLLNGIDLICKASH